MEYHQDPSSCLKLLLEEVEYLIAIESGSNGNPWICVAKLTEVFYQKHGVLLEKVAEVQGYSDGFRGLLTSSGRFSIYGTPIPTKFYVALIQEVVPSFSQFQTTSINYYKIRTSEYQPSVVPGIESVNNLEIARISAIKPILVPSIKSVNDLESALIEIINRLMANHPNKNVTTAILSKKFHDDYKQPIRTVIRSVCPDMKLIELLQTIPSLHVQKVDNDWQITVENYSIIE
ncbi:hypothetical protein K4039_06280 [Lyngbya sp. CCAP 1446/10]|uniref:hypothetical protein n=1 Tax=Lyngbya sp. CCAP 1446/10 TaxID=439293 RepID=UPI002238C287|nr:hypothetical protein [Lyngbya sp. CCAP 1446/10]MCW6049698.1 hypothetical protein [Lyngbya sp. CCAP 1446/10]